MILAGDIGGTKTRLALYETGSSARTPTREERYPSRDYPSLEAMVTSFLGNGPRPTRAAFGIAGPVVDGRVETTNLPWRIDSRVMGAELQLPVTLLNDLAATGLGITQLGPSELALLQTGEARPGSRALIAAGTGLGETIMAPDGGSWNALASEGGHVDLAARDALEDELLVWLRARYGHVSYERVLSGAGLADLYRFLAATGRSEAPPAFEQAFAAAADPAPLVSAAALDGSCPRAAMAVERFIAIYGAEAGNLALKTLAVAGVYVGGGIAPRLIALIQQGAFMRAFLDKGRLQPVLARIPVAVVLDDHCALWGAASVALAAPVVVAG